MDKATMRWKQIEKFLETHPYIMNADVRIFVLFLPLPQTGFFQVLLRMASSKNAVRVDIGYIH